MRLYLLFILSIITLPLYSAEVLRTISVTGLGEKIIKPDTVVISTGVDNGDPVIGVALEENNIAMSNIMQGLSDLGISSDDIETDNYNVYLYTPYNEKDINKEEYRVSNSIKININNLELIDTVIDTIITLGANKINGIYFTFKNSAIYQNELRTMAIKDARKKAEFLASLEDMKIIGVISIDENSGSNDISNRNFAYELAKTSSDSISSGMETISVRFNIVYQIAPK